MAVGDPLQTMTLARLDSPQVNLAAMGILKAVANFLESPIIMILHASTLLSRGSSSRRALARFTILLSSCLTLIFLSLSVEPAYSWLVLKVFGGSTEVRTQARSAFLLLTMWPATIAWRRYFQGRLIAQGHGRYLGWASLARLVAVVVLLATGWKNQLPGAVVGASALMGGVMCEAALVTWFALCSSSGEPSDERQDARLPTTMKGVLGFYAPLAYTMLITWGSRAILVSMVARSPESISAVAAWSAGWGFVLLVANATRMVQQIVISHLDTVSVRVLFQLTGCAGLFCFSLLAALAFTPVGNQLLTSFLGTDPSLTELLLPVLRVGSLVPLLVALQNCLQGFCIGRGRSWVVNLATLWGCTLTLALTWSLIHLGWNGAVAAATAMVSGISLELMVLWLICTRQTLFVRPIAVDRVE